MNYFSTLAAVDWDRDETERSDKVKFKYFELQYYDCILINGVSVRFKFKIFSWSQSHATGRIFQKNIQNLLSKKIISDFRASFQHRFQHK